MFRMETIQYNLPQSRIPQTWYNILPELPKPMAPVLHPGTLQPIGPADLTPLFPMSLIMHGRVSKPTARSKSPGRCGRSTRSGAPPRSFARAVSEKALDTPAHIYYKNEGVSPAGSHKLNTAVAQAYYNKQEGVNHLSTETGAGQWGSAFAMACASS